MNIIVVLVNVTFIFFLAYWLRSKNETLKKIFWPALLFKLIAGLVLGMVYTYYYTVADADTFLFFNDAVLLAKLARSNMAEYCSFLWHGNNSFPIWGSLYFHEPRSLLFVKIVSLFSLITADNYWVISLYFSFLTFVSSWKFVITLNRYFPRYRAASVMSFLFVPSVVFWSAGVLKESFTMATIFFIAHIFIVLWMNDKVTVLNWVGLVLSVFGLWKLKYYYAAILIPVLMTSLVVKILISPAGARKKPIVEFCWWLFMFSVLLFGVMLSRHNFKPEVFFNLVLQNNLDNVAESRSSGVIHFYHLDDTVISFVINAPWALFSGLFRPFVWEAGNLFQGIAAIENLIILILAVTALKNVIHTVSSENWLLIYSVLLCSFLLCIFLALSTPNFGTLSRYRTGFLPFFVFLITCRNKAVELTIDLVKRKLYALFGR